DARIWNDARASSWCELHHHITLAPNRIHARSTVADRLQLAADVADMHVQGAIMLGIGPAQCLLIEEGLAQRLVPVPPQQLQNAVLAEREPCPLAVMEHIIAALIEVQRTAAVMHL